MLLLNAPTSPMILIPPFPFFPLPPPPLLAWASRLTSDLAVKAVTRSVALELALGAAHPLGAAVIPWVAPVGIRRVWEGGREKEHFVCHTVQDVTLGGASEASSDGANISEVCSIPRVAPAAA
jgi:hypothetical protein